MERGSRRVCLGSFSCGRAALGLQRSCAILWRSHEALRGKRRGARDVAAADRTVPFRASGPSIMARRLANGAGPMCLGLLVNLIAHVQEGIFCYPGVLGGYLFLGSCRTREKLAASLQHPRWSAWQVFRSAVRSTCSWCERISCTILARRQRPGLRKGALQLACLFRPSHPLFALDAWAARELITAAGDL